MDVQDKCKSQQHKCHKSTSMNVEPITTSQGPISTAFYLGKFQYPKCKKGGHETLYSCLPTETDI
jgi:hypothetical protein